MSVRRRLSRRKRADAEVMTSGQINGGRGRASKDIVLTGGDNGQIVGTWMLPWRGQD